MHIALQYVGKYACLVITIYLESRSFLVCREEFSLLIYLIFTLYIYLIFNVKGFLHVVVCPPPLPNIHRSFNFMCSSNNRS